jgi:hypothetical protein
MRSPGNDQDKLRSAYMQQQQTLSSMNNAAINHQRQDARCVPSDLRWRSDGYTPFMATHNNIGAWKFSASRGNLLAEWAHGTERRLHFLGTRSFDGAEFLRERERRSVWTRNRRPKVDIITGRNGAQLGLISRQSRTNKKHRKKMLFTQESIHFGSRAGSTTIPGFDGLGIVATVSPLYRVRASI